MDLGNRQSESRLPDPSHVVNPPPPLIQRLREFHAEQSGSGTNSHGWFRTPVDLSQNRERLAPLGNRRKPLPERQETQNAERFWLSAMGVNQLGGWFRKEKISSPGRARTYDPRINSPLLYQLSYRGR